MLWDIIRDFIVQYITGGYTSVGDYYDVLLCEFTNEEVSWYIKTGQPETEITAYNGFYISTGDWLATTITIVIMCLLVVFAVWLVRWIFKAVSSAFLLK